MTLYHYTSKRNSNNIGSGNGFIRPTHDLGRRNIVDTATSWWYSVVWLTDVDDPTPETVGVSVERLQVRYVLDVEAVRWKECPLRETLRHSPTFAKSLELFEQRQAVALVRSYVTGVAVYGVRDRAYRR